MKTVQSIISCFMICVLALSFSACAATRADKVEIFSGFLGPYYDELKEGGDDQASLIYQNPSVNMSRYRQAIIAPVKAVRSKNSKLSEYSKEDLQVILERAQAVFRKELANDYVLVDSPGQNTLKIEIAITDVDRSEPVMDTITSIIPQTRMLSGLTTLATGKPWFVGGATGEGKITDALTGELIMAGVDRRVGTKNISGSTDSWNDVDQALEFWAKRLRYNLCLKQERTDCLKPEA